LRDPPFAPTIVGPRAAPVITHLAIALCFHPCGTTDVVRVEAALDNTLIQDQAGALSNGAGPAFFVGRTNQTRDSIRRGVLSFDLDGLPRDAQVVRARLVLHASATNTGVNRIHVHRLLEEWGEGSSASGGGQGAPAQPGDATWLHAFHDDVPWSTAGGHYAARASARLEVKTPGFAMAESAALARDVQAWLRYPELDHGWILVGDESASQTVTRFDSREQPDVSLRPVLELELRARARGPGSIPLPDSGLGREPRAGPNRNTGYHCTPEGAEDPHRRHVPRSRRTEPCP